jgi:formate-dependent nitrite reductase membrane component NrfD
MSRLVAVALVLGAAIADHSGSHLLAFDALLLAVPVSAVAGLREIGERAAYVWGVVLALLLVATAVRAPALGDASVPPLARSALLACVGVFCLQAVALLAGELRSPKS